MLRSQAVLRYKSKYKKVGVLPIRIVKFNVSSVGITKGPMLETLERQHTPTFYVSICVQELGVLPKAT